MDFDVIIVGAGASGAPIAARVSEDRRRTVLLLEAGPHYPTRADMPDDLLNAHNNSYVAHDWRYRAEPNASGGLVPFPRGRVVGGSSAVNTAIALRGAPEDYDEWAALGNDTWSWAKVLPYFRRLEDDRDFGGEFHGRGGPIPIRRYTDDDLTPAQSAFVRSMRAMGFPEAADNNDPCSTGLGAHPMNREGRTRMHVAICYLEAVRDRPNLNIRGNCHTCRIVFDGRRAAGVEIEMDGAVEIVRGEKIIIAAGAIASPAILMRSGIGPAAHLGDHGIDVVEDLPGVGENLQDHPLVGVVFDAKDGVLGAGDPLVQVTYRYTSAGGVERNDMQLMPVSQLPAAEGRLVYSIVSVIERQRSIGRVSLTSADPHAAPRIESRFCEHDDDVRRLVAGVRMALRVGCHEEFSAVAAGLRAPSAAVVEDDGRLATWCRQVAMSGFHPSGTVKMAPHSDPTGVVDQRLRVRGFDNLLVADASIMPTLVRANTHLTCVMIGERMGEWVREGAV